MANFEKTFISFMFLGLMIFGIFTIITNLQSNNDVEDRFMSNQLMNDTFSDLDESLNSFKDKSQAQKTLFESENPTAGFGTILLFSIVSTGKIFNGMVISIFNTLIKLPVVFLGLDPAIISVVGSILILIIIIGLWVLYKLGG